MMSWQRIYWRLVWTHLLLLAPLLVAGVIGVLLFRSDRWLLVVGISSLIGLMAIASAFLVSYISARDLARAVASAGGFVQQTSAGEYDGRIPIDERYLIEPLASALDRMNDQLRAKFAELVANRDQLRTVLDSMVEGVIAVDNDQRVMLVNNSACRLFRFQEPMAVGRPFWELIRNPQLQDWVSQAVSQTGPVGGELELLAPVNRVLMVRATGLPAKSTAGAVVVVSDVSELRRLESVRQEFVANASHELKTPLASIKACVETLLDGAIEDPENRERFLHVVGEQTDRLDKLVRDLLSLTRIESQGAMTEAHPVDIGDIIKECLERNRQHAERKNIQLLADAPEAPLLVHGDEEPLEHIFDNLIDNAIKYTNAGGKVTVRWRSSGDHARIEVEDTGIGIPHAHLARIFERFYRVDRARSRELGGTGLGLSIVKHQVQAFGGTISVNSRVGRGTTFILEFPPAEADAKLSSPPQHGAQDQSRIAHPSDAG